MKDDMHPRYKWRVRWIAIQEVQKKEKSEAGECDAYLKWTASMVRHMWWLNFPEVGWLGNQPPVTWISHAFGYLRRLSLIRTRRTFSFGKSCGPWSGREATNAERGKVNKPVLDHPGWRGPPGSRTRVRDVGKGPSCDFNSIASNLVQFSFEWLWWLINVDSIDRSVSKSSHFCKSIWYRSYIPKITRWTDNLQGKGQGYRFRRRRHLHLSSLLHPERGFKLTPDLTLQDCGGHQRTSSRSPFVGRLRHLKVSRVQMGAAKLLECGLCIAEALYQQME